MVKVGDFNDACNPWILCLHLCSSVIVLFVEIEFVSYERTVSTVERFAMLVIQSLGGGDGLTIAVGLCL